MDVVNYWNNFATAIAAPVVVAFCSWIKNEVEKDKEITDIIFVARDGYLPYKVFCQQKLVNNVKCHYVYAPRSIILANQCHELDEYKKYLSQFHFGKGKIAIVDTVTIRFSAQTMLQRYFKNDFVGLYWKLPQESLVKAHELNLKCKSFQNDQVEVPCWPLMEFIFSAPERPVKSIINGYPEYFEGNKFENERLTIFKIIEAKTINVVKSLFQENVCFLYKDVISLLDNFYHNPNSNDVKAFSNVTVSTLPDHSDDFAVPFFSSSTSNPNGNKERKFRAINKVIPYVRVLGQRIKKSLKLFDGFVELQLEKKDNIMVHPKN